MWSRPIDMINRHVIHKSPQPFAGRLFQWQFAWERFFITSKFILLLISSPSRRLSIPRFRCQFDLTQLCNSSVFGLCNFFSPFSLFSFISPDPKYRSANLCSWNRKKMAFQKHPSRAEAHIITYKPPTETNKWNTKFNYFRSSEKISKKKNFADDEKWQKKRRII